MKSNLTRLKFSNKLTLTILIISVCYLLGCGNKVNNNHYIDTLIIRNTTNSFISNIALKVTRDGRQISVTTNKITAHSQFSIGFQPQENKKSPAILVWTQDGINYEQDISTYIQHENGINKFSKLVILICNKGLIQDTIEQEYLVN